MEICLLYNIPEWGHRRNQRGKHYVRVCSRLSEKLGLDSCLYTKRSPVYSLYRILIVVSEEANEVAAKVNGHVEVAGEGEGQLWKPNTRCDDQKCDGNYIWR